MRLLIVSCSQSNTQPYYLQMFNLIVKIINEQNIISDTELVVIQRNSANLVDYLYELDTSHINPAAIHNFQAIDLFFVIGNRNIHPWNQAMWNVNCLIRMCLRLKRSVMLISGCVFESLVFQLNCGFIGNVTLINKALEANQSNIKQTQIKPTKKTDLFFDEIEGILYAYNFETNQWYRKRDCGLQNHHKLEEISRKSRYLMVRKKSPNLTMTKNIQQQCRTLMTHSLFKSVPTVFMVEYISKWRANPTNCNYNILAQTLLGPSIIQFQNIVAIQFKINPKHSSTIRILDNFIKSKLNNLFVDTKKGRIQSFLNRQQYDKPSLSIPFKRIDNTQCPLPKIQFMKRLKKSTLKQKSLSRSKILSNKSSTQNIKPSQSNQWWDGTRVSVGRKNPLFHSQSYKNINKQFKLTKIKKQLINYSKLQYYEPNKFMKQSNIRFSATDADYY